jgi:hypothetical protein
MLPVTVIRSNVDSTPDRGSGFGFKTWSYLKMNIVPDINIPNQQHDICADTGCTATLVDRQWLAAPIQSFVTVPAP